MRVLVVLLLAFIPLYGGAGVFTKDLPNGVKVLIKETEGKGIVSGVIFFRGGQHGEELPGTTSLLFTLLLKGSEKFPSSYDVSFPFEKFGGYIYSSSGDDFSEIGFSTKAEGLKEALEVIADLLTHPLLKEKDIEREKENQIIAIRSKTERGMELAMNELRKLTYRGTPYETSSLGTEESVKRIKREHLLRRFREVVRGGNIVVSIAGDIRAGDIMPMISQIFGKLEGGKIKTAVRGRGIKSSRVVKVKREGTQTTIVCAFGAPPRKSRDYFTFKVLTSALGDGMTSLLFKVLREEKGYAYATYAFYPTRLISPRLFAYVGTSPQKGESALRDLLSLVKKPKLTAEDIKMAKNKIVGDFLLDHQTRIRQAWYLGFYEVMGLGWRMDERYPEKIKGVRVRDVKRAVKEYIKNHHCVVVEP